MEQLRLQQRADVPVSSLAAPQVQVFTEGPTQGAVASRLVQAQHNDMLPTGYYLAPNNSFQVTVTRQTGTHLPQLVIGTPFRDNVRPVRTCYTLQAGVNHFKADQYGGLIYIRYVTSGMPGASASISFDSGFRPVPYYRKGITTPAGWQTMLDSLTDVPDVMLETDRAIVVAERADEIAALNLPAPAVDIMILRD